MRRTIRRRTKQRNNDAASPGVIRGNFLTIFLGSRFRASKGQRPTRANRQDIHILLFRKPLSRVESGVKPPGGKQRQSFPPGPPLAPMRYEKRLHMFGGSGCSGLLESPLTAEAILAKSPLEFLCRFRCSRNVHEMLMPSYSRSGRCPVVTQSGLPHSACLFSIRRQLINPYISLTKNITKQATIGTLATSARAAMTHSTISTRSLAA